MARARLARFAKINIADLAQIVETYAFRVFPHFCEDIVYICHAVNSTTIGTAFKV
jgi:hypothetical protein